MKFVTQARWGKARTGILTTPHGPIRTPVFMPVGTKSSVKSLTPDDLMDLSSEIILANTYHLYLRPGDSLVAELGGLHQFSTWQRPMLTDSGGFQVSSLGHFRNYENQFKTLKSPKIDENGVTFWSHLDGSEHVFTAEKSIQIQTNLGADIIMAFDEATPDKGKEYAKQAMERTHRWLVRSVAEWKKQERAKGQKLPQSLFGIIQGGNYAELRAESAKFVVSQELAGIAIGGGSIGADWRQTSQNVAWIYPYLPSEKPLYLMGVGVSPEHIIAAIIDGADMFDCVAPTRLARTGILYDGDLTTGSPIEGAEYVVEYQTKPKVYYSSSRRRARLNISNAQHKNDPTPIMSGCACYTCSHGFSKAYLRHLFIAKEILYYRLASIHNLHQMLTTARQMRSLIKHHAS